MSSSQFNIDAIPLDAYLQLWQNLGSGPIRDSLMDLNFGWYYNFDDTIYDDRIEAMKKLVVGAQDMFTQHRRLYYIHQQITAGERKANFLKFEAFYNPESSINDYMNHLKVMHVDEQLYRQQHAQFGGEFPYPIPTLDSLTVPNLGGHGVAILNRARESAERIIRDGSAIMFQHYERTGIRFDLRHPIAIGNPGITDQFYRGTTPINSLDLALGSARKAIYDLIRLIEPTTWNEDEPIRLHFNKWMALTATAIFRGDGFNTCLTQRDLPSILLWPSHDTLPVTTRIHHTPAMNDVWQEVKIMTPAQVFDGAIDPLERVVSRVDERILDLGFLMAMAASILSMNLKVGHGHHRIQWVHSFLNAAHVGESMMLAPMILHKAREAVR